MSTHCVSVLLLVCTTQACLAFVPSWTATFRSSRLQPPASAPAAATFSLSQPSGAICPVFGACGTCGAQYFYPVRGMTSLSAMSEGDEEEGGGDHDAREAADGSQAADEIRAVQDEIRGVERKIEDAEEETAEVVKKIDYIEAAIAGGSKYLGMTDPEALLKQLGRKEEQLRRKEEKEEQLRRKEEQLRDLLLKKEDRLSRIEQLRANNAPAGAVFQPVNAKLADFGAALTGALITNNTLELVNGTFFLGNPSLGSKLFIRSCYKELSALILGGASSDTFHNIVVTGTPGIGKSVFGFYLLYLLRCQGKTVVFELKGKWYRFSCAGVVKASLEAFNERDYMEDPNSWYLSDPEDRPREYFQGTTVVLVSPKYERVKEFLKLADAQQIFMPVWGLDELLKCQRAVFPHVPSTFVEEAFGVVGGVARAIFNELKYLQVKDGIEDAVNKLSLATLREAVSLLTSSGRLPTDITGDKLFHVVSDSSDGFKRYTVTFASNFTSELVIRKIAEKGRRSLLDFAGAAIDNKDVARMFGGGSVVGRLFEHAAHQVIGWDRAGEEPLKMAILIDSGGVLSGTDSLNFSFEKREGFKGETIYSSFDQGVYYTAVPLNYPAIDSFGMDRRGDTLFFFQMKYAGVKAVIGSAVERYWRTASKGSVSVKNCVYVYVVPEEPQWRLQAIKSAGIDEVRKLLSEASDDFLSACAVCVVAIPSRNSSNDVE